MSVSREKAGEIRLGSLQKLHCTVSLPQYDIPLQVMIQWSSPTSLFNESTIEISPDEINSSYKLILVIQSYNAMDSGSYTCSTLVEAIAGKSVFVLPGNSSSSLTVVATNGRPICTHVMDICNT